LFSASRAGGLSFDLGVTVILSGRRSRAEHGNPFGFASLATLGFILELLIVEEKLFPGGENKITVTVDTLVYCSPSLLPLDSARHAPGWAWVLTIVL
jgi:hypothetical protein